MLSNTFSSAQQVTHIHTHTHTQTQTQMEEAVHNKRPHRACETEPSIQREDLGQERLSSQQGMF